MRSGIIPALLLAGFCAFGADVAEEALAARNVTLTYAVEVSDIPEGASAIDVWLPVAHDTDGQTVSRVEVLEPEGGAIATEPTYGNRIWHKRFEAPFATPIRVAIEFDIHRTEIVVPEAKSLATTPKGKSALDAYLRSNRLIPVDYDPITETALKLDLANKPPILAARTVYDWLIDEFTYDWQADGAGIGDVRWACDSKTGDCSDYHSMFLALCRSQGIPADHEFGFPIRTERPSGRIAFYHCWARFHVEGIGWIPIDASEADKHPELRDYNFGSLTHNYLKFSHGRDVNLVPQQAGPPLNKFIHPYIEIDGEPTEDFTWRVDYETIDE